MKKLIPFYPLVLAMFPILALYATNISELSLSELVWPLVIGVSVSLVLLLAGWLILKNLRKSSLIVTVFLVLFFSYGHIYPLVQDFIGDWVAVKLPVFWLIAFCICLAFIVWVKRDLKVVTNILAIVSVSFVLVASISIGVHEIGGEATASDTQPSIYYIILDGYASSDTLQDIYGYDNSEFTNNLTDKGFYVASNSHSNYAETFTSLASSLNIEYINYLSETVGVISQDREVANKLVRKNKVAQTLQEKGYKFINISSGWGPTDYNKFADENFKCDSLSEFRTILIETTALRIFEKSLIADVSRERILYSFTKLEELSGSDGPKFILAHITCPHPPYLFGKDGEDVSSELSLQGDVWTEKEAYLNQLIFISSRVEVVVDTILSNSKVPPVIVLQADHGSASTFEGNNWDNPTKIMLDERMSILNAYYVPKEIKSILYNSITPVNTFRAILGYELLEDKVYYSTYEYPYRFTEVENNIKEAEYGNRE